MPNRKVAIRDALTGIRGLDDVLGGGLTPNRLYLLEGMPGSGKTTLAFQFLMEGVRQGENVLYVTLSETEEEIRAVAQTHGWSLDGIAVRELVPTQENLDPDEQYTMFHPSEVELSDTTRKILEDVERIKPSRLVFDSLSELRLLAGNPLRYRRQILALKHYFSGRQCTVLLLDDLTGEGHDLQVQSIAHGVLLLQQHAPDYGKQRRRLNVLKYRGRAFRGGYHDYVIRRGGLDVFPRLVAAEHLPGPGKAASPPASKGSTLCWAAGWTAAPAHSSPARPAPASLPSPSCSPTPRSSAARRQRCSSSMRACGHCSRGWVRSASTCSRTSTPAGSSSTRSTRRNGRPANSATQCVQR